MRSLPIEAEEFVKKSQQNVRSMAVFGWILVAVPVLCWIVIGLGHNQLAEKFSEAMTMQSGNSPVGKRVKEENLRLEALQPTTPLEIELRDRLIKRNEAMSAMSIASLFILWCAVLAATLGGVLMMGCHILASTRWMQRLLQVIEILRR